MPERTRDIPRPDNFCCAPECLAEPIELAPTPLCGHHLRKTYEFASGLVNERWAGAVAEIHAEERARAAEPKVKKVKPLTPAGEVIEQVCSQGFVYFIRFSDRIKIGWSGDPQRRIRDLPHDEILAIIPGTIADERQYHFRFHYLRVYGEWFKAEQDLVDFVATLAA